MSKMMIHDKTPLGLLALSRPAWSSVSMVSDKKRKRFLLMSMHQ
jgi:hypothetical protein